MKVSVNSIRGLNKRYQCADDFKISDDELIAKIGAQLGAVDEVIKLGDKYQGIVIARVDSCNKHPDADKLSLCKIDDGGVVKDIERDANGHIQVVCGAPNVHAGMLAAWLPPGATVPSTVGKEPLLLEAREIRGQKSNGMLASPKELALGDSHEGLLEIDGDHQPGSDFAETFELKGDVVLDIENKMFTHRPDCFGFLGIARELAGIQGLPFKSPEWYRADVTFPSTEADELKLEIKNELPELVPRFTAITMRDIQVGPSPVWLQVELAKIGVKSINNIVDYTNFFMLETSQPLHAYDYDKVKALSAGEATIVIRNPKPGEKLKLLNGKEIEPRLEAIMIATDKQLIGVGGVMGGAETEVDENTKNIILECANFDMYSIRRTSMAHGLFTDAVTRFTKGQSSLQNPAVLGKIVNEIREHASGKVAGPVVDDNHVDQAAISRNSLHPPVTVSAAFINARLGLKLSVEDMKKLLENVEFQIETGGDELTVTAPFWRTDIELREDVVEEIGRLYGYDKLPLELPQRDLTPATQDKLLELKAGIREALSRAGANEVLTYSFVHGDLLDKVGQDKSEAFQIGNALSPDLQYYRLSLTPNLLEKVHPNIKAGYDQFALFELGKAHDQQTLNEDGLPMEFDSLALVWATKNSKRPGASYYEARKFLIHLADNLGQQLEFMALNEHVLQSDHPFEPARSAVIYLKGSKEGFGIVGEFTAAVRRNLKLPAQTAGFELALGAFMNAVRRQSYIALSRFPKVTQDITLQVPTELTYQELFGFVNSQLDEAKPEHSVVQLEPVDIYQKEADQQHKNVTFHLSIASYDRTLTDTEVNKLLNTVAAAAQEKMNAARI